MVKHIFTSLIIVLCAGTLSAQRLAPATYQENTGTSGFSSNNIFLGGAVSLGFGSGYFNAGGTPEVGYSFSQWIDAGLAVNINYQSLKDYYGNTQNSFNYGGGVFARVYPIPFIFLQVQPEYNWMSYTLKTGNGASSSVTVGAPSILAGIGYSQRIVGKASFYTALLFDVNKDPNSPYRGYDGSFIPILRAGFNIYLHGNR